MTPLDYWRGWLATFIVGVPILYGVIRLAVRHAHRDHDRDAGIVRR
jgi:hypothetical protein